MGGYSSSTPAKARASTGARLDPHSSLSRDCFVPLAQPPALAAIHSGAPAAAAALLRRFPDDVWLQRRGVRVLGSLASRGWAAASRAHPPPPSLALVTSTRSNVVVVQEPVGTTAGALDAVLLRVSKAPPPRRDTTAAASASAPLPAVDPGLAADLGGALAALWADCGPASPSAALPRDPPASSAALSRALASTLPPPGSHGAAFGAPSSLSAALDALLSLLWSDGRGGHRPQLVPSLHAAADSGAVEALSAFLIVCPAPGCCAAVPGPPCGACSSRADGAVSALWRLAQRSPGAPARILAAGGHHALLRRLEGCGGGGGGGGSASRGASLCRALSAVAERCPLQDAFAARCLAAAAGVRLSSGPAAADAA